MTSTATRWNQTKSVWEEVDPHTMKPLIMGYRAFRKKFLETKREEIIGSVTDEMIEDAYVKYVEKMV